MAKTRQLVVRMDPDIADDVDAAVGRFKRSRAVVIAAALHHFVTLRPAKQRAAIVAYATRDIPKAPDDGGERKARTRAGGT